MFSSGACSVLHAAKSTRSGRRRGTDSRPKCVHFCFESVPSILEALASLHRTAAVILYTILHRASHLCRLSRFTVQSCHEFEVKLVKEKDRAKRKEVRSNARRCRYLKYAQLLVYMLAPLIRFVAWRSLSGG